MPLANTGEAVVLTALLTGRYASLHTGIPTGGNEVVGGAYARQAATFTQTGNNPTTASNDSVLTYPTATADWGTITHFGIYDAAVGGNLLGYDVVAVAKAIPLGDIARFPIGALEATAD